MCIFWERVTLKKAIGADSNSDTLQNSGDYLNDIEAYLERLSVNGTAEHTHLNWTGSTGLHYQCVDGSMDLLPAGPQDAVR